MKINFYGGAKITGEKWESGKIEFIYNFLLIKSINYI